MLVKSTNSSLPTNYYFAIPLSLQPGIKNLWNYETKTFHCYRIHYFTDLSNQRKETKIKTSEDFFSLMVNGRKDHRRQVTIFLKYF